MAEKSDFGMILGMQTLTWHLYFRNYIRFVSHKNANVNEYVEVINGRVHWNATLVRSA